VGVSVQRSWIDEFSEKLQRKGNDESSVERTRYELLRLRDHYKIDLVSVSQEELLAHLTAYRQKHKPNGYRLHVVRIRHALGFLGRDQLLEEIELPKRADPVATIHVIAPSDQVKLIQEASTPTLRLAFELLTELGGRRGEIRAIRIKDVQFDEYGAIIRLEGKTGVRPRRLYAAVPDLRAYLNAHPHKDNPNWPLLVKPNGEGYMDRGFYAMIRREGYRILGRSISPKMFRHTRATEDSRYFTDRELMKLNGWSSPAMVAVYSHLSMRDVEDKDLVLHGMKKKEEMLRPLLRIQKCLHCSQENAPVAIYCTNCGELLPNARPEELKKLNQKNEELQARLARLEGMVETVFQKKITDTTT
jgi:integrase